MAVTNDGFDIAVVGAGAAGCVVASRLAAASERSVVLLEAGPAMNRPTPADAADGWRLPVVPDWGYQSEPGPGGATSKLRRGRVLGGTSWLTRFAVRGAAADFDAWAARGNKGWSFAEILPVFRRVEADAEFGEAAWHGDRGPIPITRYPNLPRSAIHEAALEAFDAVGIPRIEDHNEPGAIGAGPMPMSSRDGVRITSADAYLADGTRPPNLVIRTGAMVATVVLESGRATAVELDDGTSIQADLIVLAAGTYGSPAILMRSGIGPADHLDELGIRVQVDLPGVGANLADHPAVELDSGWRGSGTNGPILHTIATLRSSGAPGDGAPDLMFWITDPEGEEAGLWFDPILLKPRSRGSVRLRSADPAAPLRIRLPGLSDAHDVDRLTEAYRLGLELARRPEIRRHATDAPPTDPSTPDAWRRRIVENASSIPHVVGTCAMGPSPDRGDVVDAAGRVHGVNRLRVVDASIMPEAPSGFPHLVTIMLAERLAESIAAERD